ncbi:hypothetical protein DFH08DRAFT_884155 [Mycena albidolilacea]|uniref:Uncharacterized protein n=1 Tax=Mycena albidolilacea TaxID=1033008 RepID=A0AAD6ZLG4_9AGAR|nr:hypothetical protein DFH08DRAFT_884155 [Mycena albidolilacea]
MALMWLSGKHSRCRNSWSRAFLIDLPHPEKMHIPLPLAVWALAAAFMDVAAAQLSRTLVFASSTDATNSTTSTFGSASPSTTDSATPPVASSSAADPSLTPASTFLFSGTVSFASASAWPTGIIVAPSPSPSSSGVPYVADASASKGPIIAAAVGGSIAASLVVLAGALFCLRMRLPLRPRTPPRDRSPTSAAEDPVALAGRCTALEREVSTLRERLSRLEARTVPAAPLMMYTNEKDGEALDGKVAKDHPPTYVD